MEFGSYSFKHYPLITKEMINDPDVADKMFVDTVQVNNLYLASIGGDFDGYRYL
jgi:hypothetical protein